MSLSFKGETASVPEGGAPALSDSRMASPMNFWTVVFMGRFGDSEIEAALFEALEFLRNGKAANFTLYLVGERFKNDLLV